ncbi:MAG: SDR family oxidoreductase [Bdellovibrionota bacterium]
MKGKICLVTGSNSGIGFETVVGLARQGATVIMACRDSEKSRNALADAKNRSGSTDILLLSVDLSSQASIRKLADEFKANYKRLDVLLHNAGYVSYKKELSPDGIETQFAVNLLAPFLLSNLLLDVLQKSAPSRIVVVSSDSHRMGWLNFDNLQGEKRYIGLLQYGHTKLAVNLAMLELARRLEGTGVTVNCLHPGGVKTPMFENATPKILRPLLGYLLLTPEKGARTSLFAATAPELEGVTGAYLKNSKVAQASRRARNEKTARRVWDICARLTGLQQAQA